jgi:hypothetical protein
VPAVQELYQQWARPPGRPSELRRLLRVAYDSVSGPASPGHGRSGAWFGEQVGGRITELLDLSTVEQIVASDVQSCLVLEAGRNGKTLRREPDALAAHDGKILFVQMKSSRGDGDGPPASNGGGRRAPLSPAGGTPSARARQVDSERPAVVRVPATAH